MIKIENTEVVGWESAIRGMRNPMNSWDKSDSDFKPLATKDESVWCIGNKDYALMKKLAEAGSVHAKYRRMIVVYADITAPLYWWKEADTHKIGTVRNSCSTMHKIHDKEFTLDDFSHEHLKSPSKKLLNDIIELLNDWRIHYQVDSNVKKDYWWQMIQLLPSSYNQRSTLMLNYEVLTNIYRSRKDHKLDEWREFCGWIESLPYSEIITGGNENE
jgi:hypothetical protein